MVVNVCKVSTRAAFLWGLTEVLQLGGVRGVPAKTLSLGSRQWLLIKTWKLGGGPWSEAKAVFVSGFLRPVLNLWSMNGCGIYSDYIQHAHTNPTSVTCEHVNVWCNGICTVVHMYLCHLYVQLRSRDTKNDCHATMKWYEWLKWDKAESIPTEDSYLHPLLLLLHMHALNAIESDTPIIRPSIRLTFTGCKFLKYGNFGHLSKPVLHTHTSCAIKFKSSHNMQAQWRISEGDFMLQWFCW